MPEILSHLYHFSQKGISSVRAHSPLKEHSPTRNQLPGNTCTAVEYLTNENSKEPSKTANPPAIGDILGVSTHARVPMVGGGISFRAVPKTNLERDAFVSENRRFLYALTSRYELRVLLLFGLGLAGRC